MLIRKAGMILTSLLLLWAGGCAEHRAPEPMDAQEIDALKTKLGLISVTRAQYEPHVEVTVPSKGPQEGAQDGIKVGALYPIQISVAAMLQGCNDPACLLLPLAGLALAPVGALVGGVGGTITADSAEIVSEREIRIKDALAKLRMQENMRDHVLSRLADLKLFPFATMTEGPATEGEKPDYRQFKSSGISSVNEIDVKKLTLAGWGKVRPDLYVQLEVQARLISTIDNTEIYCKVFTCSSKDDKFEVWAAQDAKKFREEIESCYNDIADWLVNDLYVNDSIIMKKETYTSWGQNLPRQSTAKCK